MLKDFKNVKENVLNLTKLFPATKENYNTLLFHYWAIYDGATSLDAVTKLTPAETITRCFRKLVELGFIEVPEKTTKARAEAQKEYKSEFASLI